MVVDIRSGIVVKHRDAGRRVQREFWEGDVVCVEGYGGVRRVTSLSWIGHKTRKGLKRLYVVTVLLGRASRELWAKVSERSTAMDRQGSAG